MQVKNYIKLLRPKDWAKNLFLFIPAFFTKYIFVSPTSGLLLLGFAAFSCAASSIYIINDYRDIEEDRKHPVKLNRPLASGKVKTGHALLICLLLIITGCVLAWFANPGLQFLLVLGAYFFVNLGYSLGLKNIAILDMIILASGFVFRVKAGAIIGRVDCSEWLIIMTFLLALFMAIGKRRDDVLLKDAGRGEMRKSMSGYNLEFLNAGLGLAAGVIIVAYIAYTQSPNTINRLGTYRLYYSSLFVIAGIMRYMQVVFVKKSAGSPTEVLYKDRFIQLTIALWIISIYVILYLLPNNPILINKT